jgi:predicted protein tyrosine phosphatase
MNNLISHQIKRFRMRRIMIGSKESMKDFSVSERTLLLRISDARDWGPTIRSDLVVEKRMRFGEADPSILKLKPHERIRKPGTVFRERHANEIYDFTESHPDYHDIFIHCYAGSSRAPTVGLAIQEVYGGIVSVEWDERSFDDFSWFKKDAACLRHIYEAMMETAHKRGLKPRH